MQFQQREVIKQIFTKETVIKLNILQNKSVQVNKTVQIAIDTQYICFTEY